ncbi:MAG: outer membrane beta-barrel protein [Chitinophagales bacterium]
MRDELNQYEMMEERLRRELSKYEASFEPDDWMLMEEKLDEADASYFAFASHPYFRLAAAALFLLTSLYGVESLISTYFSTSNDNYTHITPIDRDNQKKDETIKSIVNSSGISNENGYEYNNESSINKATTSIGNSTDVDIALNIQTNYRDSSNKNWNSYSTEEQEFEIQSEKLNGQKSSENFISLAAHSERRMSRLPIAIPFNENLVQIEDRIIRKKRRMPGKRTVRTKITHSLTSSPSVPKSNQSKVSIGLYTSIDKNFLDFSTTMQSGVSSGIEVKIKPKEDGKFSLITGVGYSRKKFKTEDVPNNPLMSFLRLGGFGDRTENTTSTFTSEMEVVEVPLLVQYTFGKESKKVQPYIEAGTMVYIPINQQYTYRSTSSWNQTYTSQIPPNQIGGDGTGHVSEANVGLEIRGEHKNGSSKPYLGIANVNAGVNVQLSKRVNAHIEGQVKGSLGKHKLDRSIPETELNIGLSGGNTISENNFNNRKGLYTLGLQLGVSCAL